MLEKTLKKLISFKSVSRDQKANRRLLDWVKKETSGLPVFTYDFVSNGFPSLIVGTRKTKTPAVCLLAHTDVVAGSDNMFRARKAGNKLYGRGTFDMKFAAACYIELLKDLKDLKNYNLMMLLTSDEELGGRDGAGDLVKQGLRPKVVILPDGGENWTVQRGAKGIYQFEVKARGKSGHSSRPWTGRNAIEELTGFMQNLKGNFPAEPCRDKEHNHATMNVSEISGGTVINQIADQASAKIDIRFPAKISLSKLRILIHKTAQKHGGIKIMEINSADPYELDMQNRLVKNFCKILRKRTGAKPTFIRSHGSSDAR